jgi:urea transport system substrate-binding protein
MEATVIGFNMWVKAVETAGTTDVDKVIDAMIGIEVPNMTGGTAKMLANHHLTKPVLIGEIQEDGQFEVVFSTDGEVPGDAWSDYLIGSKDVISDWTGETTGGHPCGNYNTVTKTCSGQHYE